MNSKPTYSTEIDY